MSFYDEIVSPFEDNETIKELIKIFAKRQDNMYHDIIYNSYDEKINDKEYMEKFDENIYWPLMEHDYQSYNPTKEEEETYKKFKTYRQLYEYDLYHGNKEAKNKASEYLTHKLQKELEKAGRDEKELRQMVGNADEIIGAINIENKIYRTHDFKRDYLKGFHFDSKVHDRTEKKEESDIKFYINAGADSYKVAKLFLDKCRESNIDSYYFKVVNPMENEQKMTDKLCIYSTIDHAKTFLEYIQQIHAENPDIEFNKPPLTAGLIDNFIGVGTDKLEKGESYNQTIANVVTDSFESFFLKIILNIIKHMNILKRTLKC